MNKKKKLDKFKYSVNNEDLSPNEIIIEKDS
jgi:hypothetical protein